MSATNRSDKVKLLLKTLLKRYKHIPKPVERKLLECLMFAACLENAAFDAAESAYSVLEHHYIDWNELRVSTSQEIADTLPMLPQPLAAGERIKKTLQVVFETTYMFDLEDYRKRTIGQTVEYLDSIPSCTQFMTNYLVQIGLGGHHIPVDEAALRILRRLDLTKVDNGREIVPGLERIIIKSKSIEFATLIHLFGIEFFDRQDDKELLTLLQNIDKSAAARPWQEPEGVSIKTAAKPSPVRSSQPRHGDYRPVIDMDDDEGEPSGRVTKEESVEFIDTGLSLLGSGTKGNEERLADAGTSSKKKKQSSGKPDSKTKSPEQVASQKSGALLPNLDPPPKVEPKAVTKAEPTKKDMEIGKKTKEKDHKDQDHKDHKDQVPKKPESKKSTSQKKDKKILPKTQTSAPKKDQKKPPSITPKKSTKAATPKSAAKKLQQKKPR